MCWEGENYILYKGTLIEDKGKKAIKRITEFEIDNAEEVENSPDVKTVKFKIDEKLIT